MDYLTWVNQDVKRSYRYQGKVALITEHEEQIKTYQSQLNDLKGGKEFIPHGYGFLGMESVTERIIESVFLQPVTIDDITVDGVPYTYEPSEAVIQEYREASEKRRIERKEEQRQSEISHYIRLIESEQEDIDRLRRKITECELTPVVSWLKMPAEDWGRELGYRLMDVSKYHQPFTGLVTFFSDDALKDLFYVIDTLNDWGWNFNIKTKRGWVCTVSHRSIDISVTRTLINEEPTECIIRTLLTIIDLAWEHFMPKVANETHA